MICGLKCQGIDGIKLSDKTKHAGKETPHQSTLVSTVKNHEFKFRTKVCHSGIHSFCTVKANKT